LPAGHLEDDETVTSGAVREAKEELAIDIDPAALDLVHVMHQGSGRSSLFFEVNSWSGQIANGEPDKCESLPGFRKTNCPTIWFHYARAALELIHGGKNMSTFGWG
jgi:8-oxo-dGTP pyrophosphatase MutT (NUDIX family)